MQHNSKEDAEMHLFFCVKLTKLNKCVVFIFIKKTQDETNQKEVC